MDLIDNLFGSGKSDDAIEQSFGNDTGRYRQPNGQFATGGPPQDYDGGVDRFRGQDGRFKSRSRDLGAGTPHDAPRRDASTNAFEDRPTQNVEESDEWSFFGGRF